MGPLKDSGSKQKPALPPKPEKLEVVQGPSGRTIAVIPASSKTIPLKGQGAAESEATHIPDEAARVKKHPAGRVAPPPPSQQLSRLRSDSLKLFFPASAASQSHSTKSQADLADTLRKKKSGSKPEPLIPKPLLTSPTEKTASLSATPSIQISQTAGVRDDTVISPPDSLGKKEFEKRKRLIEAKMLEVKTAASSTPIHTPPSVVPGSAGSYSVSPPKKKGVWSKGERVSFDESQADLVKQLQKHLHIKEPEGVMDRIYDLNDETGSAYDSSAQSSGITSSTSSLGGTTQLLAGNRASIASSQDDEADIVQEPSAYASLFNLQQKDSALMNALIRKWDMSYEQIRKLPQRELDKVISFCQEAWALHKADVMGDETKVSSLFFNCLDQYQTLFHSLFPGTCAYLKLKRPVWKYTVLSGLQKDKKLLSMVSTGTDAKQKQCIADLLESVEEVLVSPLLEVTLIKELSYNRCVQKLNEVSRKVTELRGKIPKTGDREDREKDSDEEEIFESVDQAVAHDLKNIETKLRNDSQALIIMLNNDFRRKENWDRCVRLTASAAIEAVKLKMEGQEAGDTIESIMEWQGQQVCNTEKLPEMIKELHSLEKQLLDKFKINKGRFEKGRIEALRKEAACPKGSELQYLFNGKYHTIEVVHFPAACLKLKDSGQNAREWDMLGYDGHITPSCDRAAEDHAVNLSVTAVTNKWIEQITEGDETDECELKEVVLKEVRMGVPYAYAVSGSIRGEVSELRWKEALAVCCKFFRTQELERAVADPEYCIELPVFYNCLLSPDKLRSFFSVFEPIDDEHLWCTEMSRQVSKMSAEGVSITVRGVGKRKYKVKVKPNIFMFVCPCNKLAYASNWQFASTWDLADKINEGTFIRLFGGLDPDAGLPPDCFIQQFLDQNPALDPVVRRELDELIDLLRYMFSKKLHRLLREQPFIFSTAITELGRILNVAIISGCKSAKDRTGNYERCNIELAIRLRLIRRKLREELRKQYGPAWKSRTDLPEISVLPAVDRPLTYEDFFNGSLLLLCSGQLEAQIDNIGCPGFKIESYMLGHLKELYPVIAPS